MKKRLIIFNTLIVFIALSILLIISCFVVNNVNLKNAEQEIRNYLNLACEIYDGTNEEYTANTLYNSNRNIRVTFITKTGEVIKDTSLENDFDSHLERPEIKSLNTIVYRYSSTMKANMIYIASLEDGNYVRISLPKASINSTINNLIQYGILSLLVILAISTLIILKYNKKALKPLKTQVDKLSNIVDDTSNYKDDMEALSEQINKTARLLDAKINSIKKEKEKLKYIIDNMTQGILLIDRTSNVTLVNDSGLKIFDFSYDEMINKNYNIIIRSVELKEEIENVRKTKKTKTIELVLNNKIYRVFLNSIFFEWIHDGVFVVLEDITDEKNLENAKKEFFANASHELKSPLTIIVGYQQMIHEGILTTKEELNDANERTIKEANRMNQIIIEMLEISRLEANKMKEPENVMLETIIRDILDSYKTEIEKKNIIINLNLDDTVLEINKDDLRNLLKNVIENAIKYNKLNGMIEITTNKKEKVFVVKDTGIGIPEEHKNHVFERFYRVDKAKSKDFGGTGLGLAIVKHICLIYNYKIELESEIEKGTTIRITWE